jgi:hypothetical protein
VSYFLRGRFFGAAFFAVDLAGFFLAADFFLVDFLAALDDLPPAEDFCLRPPKIFSQLSAYCLVVPTRVAPGITFNSPHDTK